MNKKGAELPMNTLIVAIIIIIVLVVVVVFFLGGFGVIKERMRDILWKSPGGQSYDLAASTCNQYCEQARLLPATARINSNFCKTHFDIDRDNDGKIDPAPSIEKDQTCEMLGITCSGVSCTTG